MFKVLVQVSSCISMLHWIKERILQKREQKTQFTVIKKCISFSFFLILKYWFYGNEKAFSKL